MTQGKRLVIIGTSGSHDYLKAPMDNQRYWDVHKRAPAGPPSAPEDRGRLDGVERGQGAAERGTE